MKTHATPQGSQSALREANSLRLLDAIRKYGGITQVELAAATGLSTATVSTIVKQLLAQKVVETHTTTRSGRRAQLVTLARRTGLGVGVHIGHRYARVAIGDSAHDVIARQHLPLPADHRPDTTLDRVALMVVDLIESQGMEITELVGVALGISAPVHPTSRAITIPGILRGWEDLDIADVVSTRLGVRTVVDNDANLGALAESRYGAARGVSDAIYVRASHATGAGVLIEGRLHRGRRGIAGEFGHVEVDPNGAICVCGSRGCLNTVVGADAIIDRLRVSRGTLSLRDIVEYAREGDPGCRQVVADAGSRIGNALAALAATTDPDLIVVGGEFAETGDVFIGPLRDALHQRVVLGGADGLKVVPAHLGLDTEVTGALALALEDQPYAAEQRANGKDAP